MRLRLMVAAFVIATLATGGAAGAIPGNGNSAARITVEFNDSCTGFGASSSKDISHVEIHYADDRVVKDEDIGGPSHAIVGDAAIDLVIVKSGTTSAPFECEVAPPADNPPIAVLEAQNQAGAWTTGPENGPFCSAPADVCYGFVNVSQATLSFRGINSSDPDNDIASWSIDFGDGSSTGSQDWASDPPTVTHHTYAISDAQNNHFTVTLNIVDSGGRTSTDAMLVAIDVDHED